MQNVTDLLGIRNAIDNSVGKKTKNQKCTHCAITAKGGFMKTFSGKAIFVATLIGLSGLVGTSSIASANDNYRGSEVRAELNGWDFLRLIVDGHYHRRPHHPPRHPWPDYPPPHRKPYPPPPDRDDRPGRPPHHPPHRDWR